MKYHKGSIVVFALIVLSFILIAAFSVAAVTLVERRSANISVNSTTAFQKADKGMEEFLQQLYKDLEQTDTLDDLANKLNEIYPGTYDCKNPTAEASESTPSYIGDNNTEFIISAYMERPVEAHNAGWDNDALIPIRDCDTELADVARFKVAGNYSTAVRAVFVKLRDSLTRGLVAHWSFEDRANNARLATDDDQKNSFAAQDTSKNGHILTLCNIKSNSSFDVMVDVVNDIELKFDKFGLCDFNESDGMIPLKRADSDDPGCNSVICDTNGAWDSGIVKENVDTGDSTEAIYFDGNDVLMSNISSECDDQDFNCTKDADDKLRTIETGITISLWVKKDAPSSVVEELVSRYDDGSHGFKIYLDSEGKVCFKLENKSVCSNEAVDDTNWHHVLGRWGNEEKIKIIVDSEEEVSPDSALSGSLNLPNETLYIGASNDDDSGIENYFTGTIDDVRVWDRSLTDAEIFRLCFSSQGSPADLDDLKPECFGTPTP